MTNKLGDFDVKFWVQWYVSQNTKFLKCFCLFKFVYFGNIFTNFLMNFKMFSLAVFWTVSLYIYCSYKIFELFQFSVLKQNKQQQGSLFTKLVASFLSEATSSSFLCFFYLANFSNNLFVNVLLNHDENSVYILVRLFLHSFDIYGGDQFWIIEFESIYFFWLTLIHHAIKSSSMDCNEWKSKWSDFWFYFLFLWGLLTSSEATVVYTLICLFLILLMCLTSSAVAKSRLS